MLLSFGESGAGGTFGEVAFLVRDVLVSTVYSGFQSGGVLPCSLPERLTGSLGIDGDFVGIAEGDGDAVGKGSDT